jgi:hypothetical protein
LAFQASSPVGVANGPFLLSWDAGCRIGIFATDDRVPRRDAKLARAIALVRDGRIVIEGCGADADGGALGSGAAPVVADGGRACRRHVAERGPVLSKADDALDVTRVDSPAVLPPEREGAGTLVLIGGACTPDGHALGAFVHEARGVGGPIVGLTEAAADPASSARLWRSDVAAMSIRM